MKVFRGLPNATSGSPCALAIGNFDGVHRGHQVLLERVRLAATRLGVDAAVMTFEPHPREFFAQLGGDLSKAPTRIANLRDKLQSLAHAGIDRVIVEHFNAHFAALPPQSFIKEILLHGLHVQWLIVGEDFCFGAKRAGNLATLLEASKQYDFHVEILPSVLNGESRISSSEVRKALAQGDFAQTTQLLGHAYTISGHVIHGKKLGRTIGFPTINLRVAHKRPALCGIFVVRVHGLGPAALSGVASIGVRPTVEDAGRVLLETYLLDYSEQCYGKLVRVEFLKKLRDEEKYSSLSALTAAIARDVQDARAYFELTSRAAATNRI